MASTSPILVQGKPLSANAAKTGEDHEQRSQAKQDKSSEEVRIVIIPTATAEADTEVKSAGDEAKSAADSIFDRDTN